MKIMIRILTILMEIFNFNHLTVFKFNNAHTFPIYFMNINTAFISKARRTTNYLLPDTYHLKIEFYFNDRKAEVTSSFLELEEIDKFLNEYHVTRIVN